MQPNVDSQIVASAPAAEATLDYEAMAAANRARDLQNMKEGSIALGIFSESMMVPVIELSSLPFYERQAAVAIGSLALLVAVRWNYKKICESTPLFVLDAGVDSAENKPIN